MNLLHKEGCPDLADDLALKFRDIDTGVSGARSECSALSAIQTHVLVKVAKGDGRIERVGKQYRIRGMPKSVYAPTIRNLCARDLLAWDGGAFDPEAAAVVTERGRFVLALGGGVG